MTFFCRADDIFLSSSQDSYKKCQAVKIRADGFWAVDPNSSEELDTVFVCQLPQSFSDQCMTNSKGSSCKFIGDTWVEIVPAEKDKTVL
jgi:hypothetical protein